MPQPFFLFRASELIFNRLINLFFIPSPKSSQRTSFSSIDFNVSTFSTVRRSIALLEESVSCALINHVHDASVIACIPVFIILRPTKTLFDN